MNTGIIAAVRLALLTLVWTLGLAAIVGSGGGPRDDSTAAPAATIASESGGQSALLGASATFSITANNAQSYQWQTLVNGVWTNIPGATSDRYVVAEVNAAMNGSQFRATAIGRGGNATSSVFTLSVTLAPPAITGQPAAQTVNLGQIASFTVMASGSSLNYVWQVSNNGGADWSDLAGQTAASLNWPSAALTDSGKQFRAIVSNASGAVTSSSALLTVNSLSVPPTITAQPANQSGSVGQSVSFSVTVTGSSPSYAWQLSSDGASWTTLSGATAASLSVGPLVSGDNGKQYRVLVSNGAGSVTSNAALLSVVTPVAAPGIVQQPASQTITAGQNVSLTVQASGTAITYQWQLSSDSGVTWGPVSGATTSSLPLTNVPYSANGRRYRVVVANAAGTVTSNSALLTVNELVVMPSIGLQPTGGTRIVGQAFSTTAGALGGQLSYAWEYSLDGNAPWMPVNGATSATLSVPSVGIQDNGKRYRVRVSNSAGAVTSGNAVLTVAWGEVVASADLAQLESLYAGGDGGTDGGGSGAGADGGGTMGKVLSGRFTVTRVLDGALIGSTLTHPVTGLVRIKAGPGAGPFLVSLQGASGATYYDEGKNAMLPFPAGQELHALVDRMDENVGVSPLTEAAYRYAINNFVANPAAIRAGTSPLLRTGSVVGLTSAQIALANNVVLTEVNRLLPTLLQLQSIKSLGTPIDSSSSSSALPVSRYGKSAVANGGLVRRANNYFPTSTEPALEVAEQLARDLTDGVINGFALDGTPASSSAIYYDVARDAVELGAAGASISRQFGAGTTLSLSPAMLDFIEGSVFTSCWELVDNIALTREGHLNVLRTTPGTASQCLNGDANTRQLLSAFVTDVRFVRNTFSQVFVVKNDGSVLAWGNAECGRLGNGSVTGRFAAPVSVPGLRDVTSLATGTGHGIARDKQGFVYTWGSNGYYGVLGLGPSPSFDIASCERDSLGTYGANLVPTRVPGLPNIISVASGQLTSMAMDVTGRIYQWGMVTTSRAVADRVSTPTLVPGLSGATAMAVSVSANFALKADGTVWGWGPNLNGEIGDGTQTSRATPVQVPGLTDVVQVASDQGDGAVALLRDGTVRIWGDAFNRTPTTPTSIQFCRVAWTMAGQCLSYGQMPMPKARHISGNGRYVTLFGVDGKVYLRAGGLGYLVELDPSYLGLP